MIGLRGRVRADRRPAALPGWPDQPKTASIQRVRWALSSPMVPAARGRLMRPGARGGEDADDLAGRDGEADAGNPVGDRQRELRLGTFRQGGSEGAQIC